MPFKQESWSEFPIIVEVDPEWHSFCLIVVGRRREVANLKKKKKTKSGPESSNIEILPCRIFATWIHSI